MTRGHWILFSVVAGTVFFALAAYRVGAEDPGWSICCGAAFYPLQTLVLELVGYGLSPAGLLALMALLCLPWYPLLATLITSRETEIRVMGIVLGVVNVCASVALLYALHLFATVDNL